MSLQPVVPTHLLTVAEYLQIGELESGYSELVVVVAVEVLSPGSRRTDNVQKRSEYADAGVQHYWILDATEPVSLLACHLAGEYGYTDSGAVTGTFTTDAPFPLTIDLDALL